MKQFSFLSYNSQHKTAGSLHSKKFSVKNSTRQGQGSDGSAQDVITGCRLLRNGNAPNTHRSEKERQQRSRKHLDGLQTRKLTFLKSIRRQAVQLV